MADGVDATPDVLTSRRPQVDIEHDARGATFQDSNWSESTRERDQFVANIVRTNMTGSSGRSGSQSSTFDAANTRQFPPPNMLCSTTCSDRDSHGVSDPSGQARGHVGRAQRGRSRHRLLL
jgi:hypothetical protein